MDKQTLDSEPMKKKKTTSETPHMIPFPVKLEPELIEALKKIAAKDDRTVSYIAREALRRYVEKETKK